jgi:hypothetical protein
MATVLMQGLMQGYDENNVDVEYSQAMPLRGTLTYSACSTI